MLEAEMAIRYNENYRPTVQMVRIENLLPNARNPRKHPKRQIRQLEKSICEFGFTNPVAIDAEGHIIAGNARVIAARNLGLSELPTICLDHLSKEQVRALIIADNRLSDNSQFDFEILTEELKLTLPHLDDIEAIGFSTAEIDKLCREVIGYQGGLQEVDEISEGLTVTRRCRTGDLWQLGAHRLICGDARCGKTISALMGGEQAQMAFTDPPYNIKIESNVSGKGRIKHADFLMGAGELTKAEFTNFLEESLRQAFEAGADGAIFYVCMDWRHLPELSEAAHRLGITQINLAVWRKDVAGMGSLYRSQHELICIYKKGDAPHINNVQLGRHGRNRTNIWEYPAINSRKSSNRKDLALHPTAKPVEMVADAIRDVSERNGIVLDLFGGSGSTLIAAEQTGRRARICEIDPHYCDVILNRYEAFAKDDVELLACGWPRPSPNERRRG
jgi:DNA modification methylase